jgi:hypothetical protein
MSLQLGKRHFDRIEVRAVRRQEKNQGQRCLIAPSHPSQLNLAASSGIVMSDSTSTPLEQGRQIRRQFTAARLPPLLRRLR